MFRINVKHLSIVCGALLSASANSALIFDNGTDKVNIAGSCSSCSDTSAPWRVFDDFTLNSFHALDYLSIDLSTRKNYSNGLEFSIWNNDLSAKLHTYNYAWSAGTYQINRADHVKYDNVTIDLDLGSSTLDAGTYYLSVLGVDIQVPRSGDGTHLNYRKPNLTTYANSTGYNRTSDLHFRLSSDPVTTTSTANVNEPYTFILMAVGLAALGFTRKTQLS